MNLIGEDIMTEVEKIAYTRMYIEVANGINPLTDQAVPDRIDQ